MPAEVELVGIRGGTRPHPDFLGGSGKRVQSGEHEDGGDEELSESKHVQM
jgi:hypothetical protein